MIQFLIVNDEEPVVRFFEDANFNRQILCIVFFQIQLRGRGVLQYAPTELRPYWEMPSF